MKVLGIPAFARGLRPDLANVPRIDGLADIDPDAFLRDGDLLFVRSNGNPDLVGRCVIIDDPCEPVTHSGFTIRARPRASEILPLYAAYFFQSPAAKSQLRRGGAGTNISNLSQSTLAKIRLPLPEVRTQHAVTQVLTTAEQAFEAAARIVDAQNRLKLAVLGTFFSRESMTRRSWAMRRIDELGEVRGGRQRSPHLTMGNPRPYLRVANVYDGYVDSSDVYEMLFTDEEFSTFRLVHGDILLNEGQSTELVGRAAMYRDEPRDCAFQNSLIRFRAKPGVDPYFVLQVFRFYQYTGRFAAVSSKTTSMAHLGVERFAAMRIPHPPMSEQAAIARLLDTLDEQLRLQERRRDLLRHELNGLIARVYGGAVSPRFDALAAKL